MPIEFSVPVPCTTAIESISFERTECTYYCLFFTTFFFCELYSFFSKLSIYITIDFKFNATSRTGFFVQWNYVHFNRWYYKQNQILIPIIMNEMIFSWFRFIFSQLVGKIRNTFIDIKQKRNYFGIQYFIETFFIGFFIGIQKTN